MLVDHGVETTEAEKDEVCWCVYVVCCVSTKVMLRFLSLRTGLCDVLDVLF